MQSYVQAHGCISDALDAYGISDVPEGETIWPGKERLEVNLRNRRIAASAADPAGRPVSSNESYTWLAMPRFLVRLDQMKAASDAIFLDGIRQIKNHGFPSSPAALGKPGWAFYASTFINPNQTWWPHYHALAAYVARMNYLMQSGERVSDIALYAGVPDLRAHYNTPKAAWLGEDDAWHHPERDPGLDTTARIAAHLDDVAQRLYQRGYGFDIVGDTALARQLEVRGPTLSGTTRRYRAVILKQPDSLPLESLRKLAAFVQAGGLVITLGQRVRRGAGLNGDQEVSQVNTLARGFVQVSSLDELGRLLESKHLRDFVAPPGVSYRALHRQAGAVDYYFVSSGDRVARSYEIKLRDANGRPAQLWDPMSGEIRTWNGGKLELGAWGSAVIVYGLGAAPEAPRVAWSAPKAIVSKWAFTAEGNLAYAKPAMALGDWLQVPELRSFAGIGVYRSRLDAPPGASRARVCLGRVEQSAELLLNNRSAGVTFLPPNCIEGAVTPGVNTLEVRVANTWSNAIAAMPPQPSVLPGKGYGITDVLYGESARPPQSGGLLGPVTVEFQ
jgi:hypothetical protein